MIESVASITGIDGHSIQWSLTTSPHIVANHSIGWISQVRTGGGWRISQSYVYTQLFETLNI